MNWHVRQIVVESRTLRKTTRAFVQHGGDRYNNKRGGMCPGGCPGLQNRWQVAQSRLRWVRLPHLPAMSNDKAMLHLVAVILTYNEAYHIAACVAALREWVEAVVVWDSGSTDDTAVRAAMAGALVVQRPFDNYAAQRQAALDSIAAEWIFFVDADERATPALAAEVRQAIAAPDAAAGYWAPRRNFIVGHEMRAGGFSPDYQLRLLRRSAATYDPDRQVHEVVALRGAAAHLANPLIHYNYQNWAQFHRKQRAYAAYEAHILAARGIRPRPHNFILQPIREFTRRYVALEGWRDGGQGVRMAFWLAWYYGLLPYAILLQKQCAAE